MCTITLTALDRAPLALVAHPRGAITLTAPARGPLSVSGRLRQRRLITSTTAYLVTQDGRRFVVGVCNA
jgi:hypothetical protein